MKSFALPFGAEESVAFAWEVVTSGEERMQNSGREARRVEKERGGSSFGEGRAECRRVWRWRGSSGRGESDGGRGVWDVQAARTRMSSRTPVPSARLW